MTIDRNYGPLASESFIRAANGTRRLNEHLDRIVFSQASKQIRNRPLSVDQVERFARFTRDLLKKDRPLAFDEQRRQGSDGQTEAVEFRTITRRFQQGRTNTHLYLVANTIYIDKTRIYADEEDLPTSTTSHCLDRFAERFVGRDPAEYELEMIWTTGLSVLWQHAAVAEGVNTQNIIAPIKGGLMMGRVSREENSAIGSKRTISRLGDRRDPMLTRPIMSPDSALMLLNEMQAKHFTTVDDSRLYPIQRHYAQVMRAFVDEHRSTLNRITGATIWSTARLRPRPTFNDMAALLMPASKTLRKIIKQSEIKELLKHTEARYAAHIQMPEHTFSEQAHSPELSMAHF